MNKGKPGGLFFLPSADRRIIRRARFKAASQSFINYPAFVMLLRNHEIGKLDMQLFTIRAAQAAEPEPQHSARAVYDMTPTTIIAGQNLITVRANRSLPIYYKEYAAFHIEVHRKTSSNNHKITSFRQDIRPAYIHRKKDRKNTHPLHLLFIGDTD